MAQSLHFNHLTFFTRLLCHARAVLNGLAPFDLERAEYDPPKAGSFPRLQTLYELVDLRFVLGAQRCVVNALQVDSHVGYRTLYRRSQHVHSNLKIGSYGGMNDGA